MGFLGLNFSIHSDGLKFIAIATVASLVTMVFCDSLGWIGFGLTAFCMFFFRNPKRMVCSNDNQLVSPIDSR
jgi:phosphatidylserine decarboxylase